MVRSPMEKSQGRQINLVRSKIFMWKKRHENGFNEWSINKRILFANARKVYYSFAKKNVWIIKIKQNFRDNYEYFWAGAKISRGTLFWENGVSERISTGKYLLRFYLILQCNEISALNYGFLKKSFNYECTVVQVTIRVGTLAYDLVPAICDTCQKTS